MGTLRLRLGPCSPHQGLSLMATSTVRAWAGAATTCEPSLSHARALDWPAAHWAPDQLHPACSPSAGVFSAALLLPARSLPWLCYRVIAEFLACLGVPSSSIPPV